ncbi:hypothetical protein SXCC_00467 [Gluconacetobacter sp. SXCC-1]|nr:hypothetical protein SXCC_00467 [Gluconacetobacter sp. SXCC-1]
MRYAMEVQKIAVKLFPRVFIQSYHLEQAFRRMVDLIKIVVLALPPVTDGLVRLHPIGGVVLSGMNWRSRIFLPCAC